MYTSRQQLQQDLTSGEIIEEDIGEEAARLIAAAARPGVWLRTLGVDDEAEIPLGASKIGGRPDLPAGMPWPMRPAYPDAPERAALHRRGAEMADSALSWATSEQVAEFRRDFGEIAEAVTRPFPLQFIAQFDLAEIGRAGPLDPDIPEDGLLSIFWDLPEFPESFAPAAATGMKVLYQAAPVGPLQRLETPAELTALLRFRPIAPVACAPAAFLAPVPTASAEFEALGLDADTASAYSDWLSEADEAYSADDGEDWKCHRVGGWPTPLQGDMQTECALVAAGHYVGTHDDYLAAIGSPATAAARDWVFVAQIGSDEKARLALGDSGQLYVWVRRADLVARDFARARIVMQCF
jgi:uncharacterized protein YwqG